MDYKEAAESGKPFKRERWDHYLTVDGIDVVGPDGDLYALSVTDVNADDWMTLEEEVMMEDRCCDGDSSIIFHKRVTEDGTFKELTHLIHNVKIEEGSSIEVVIHN